jgi:hypothetical protein
MIRFTEDFTILNKKRNIGKVALMIKTRIFRKIMKASYPPLIKLDKGISRTLLNPSLRVSSNSTKRCRTQKGIIKSNT